MVKKIFFCLLTGIILLMLFSITVSSAEIRSQGYCGGEGDGRNLMWTLDTEGLLTITGNGKMANFNNVETPWYPIPAISSVVIEDGVTSIGHSAFYYFYNITSITIPESVTSIENRAFGFTSIESITLPSSLTTLGSSAFVDCHNLLEITIPSGITVIHNNTFENCFSLKTVVLPKKLVVIEDFAFNECYNLTDISIPQTVTSIGERAFSSCESFTSITLPISLIFLDNFAFASCKNMTSVTILSKELILADTSFSKSPLSVMNIFAGSNATNYALENGISIQILPDDLLLETGSCGSQLTWVFYANGTLRISGTGAMDDCLNDSPWSSYTEHITTIFIEKGVSSIGAYAFSSCNALQKVHFSDGCVTLGTACFSNCTSLTRITLPATITTLGGSVFAYCSNLQSVYFLGEPPAFWGAPGMYEEFYETSPSLTLYYLETSSGWESPLWRAPNQIEYTTAIFEPAVGDIDCDGEITIHDVVLMSEYFAGYSHSKLISQTVADVNGDGNITRADCMILARYVAGWSGYELS